VVLLNYGVQEKDAYVSAQGSRLRTRSVSNIVADGSDENPCGDEP